MVMAWACLAGKANVASQCNQYRSLAESNARPFEIEQAHQGVEITCSCVPAEIDRLADSKSPASVRPKDQAEAIARGAFEFCGARSLRARVVSECRKNDAKFPQVEARARYCQCVETRLGELSDQRIVDESLRANRQYEAAVDARLKGKSPPSPEPSEISNIEQACRALLVEHIYSKARNAERFWRT